MGAGGMRSGAGRPGWHVKAEHCKRIDIRRWAREGLLRPGVSSSWVWTDRETGEHLASIGFRAAEHSVSLSYSLNDVPMRQHVPVDRTTCHYGGERAWFGCPRCSRRVAVLYLRNSGFACRLCQRVAYASQSGDASDRAWRRQYKLEARLDANWQRPKGMHQRTHERLLDRIIDCEQQREAALAGFLSKFAHLLRR